MSDVSMVRLLTADLADPESDRLLSDGQLTNLLDLEGGVVKLAAARALETVAISEALVSKKIRTQDLTTDGPAVSKELRETAAQLRSEAAAEIGGADEGVFEVFDYPQVRYGAAF